MGGIIFGTEPVCSDTTIKPIALGVAEATRTEWSVLEKPAGSQVIFSDPNIPEPQISVTEDGTYVFQMCCYFDEGDVTAGNAGFDEGLSCPLGVIAGQVANVTLNGCENGSISNATVTGAATGITFASDGTGRVTTSVNGSGRVDVSVDCTLFDNDGNSTTENFTCSFEVIAFGTVLACETSAPVTSSFITCGQSCRCDTATVVFDCGIVSENSAEIGLVFMDCPPCPDDEECEALTRIPLTGSKLPSPIPININDCGCYEENIYAKDQPVLYWNNICSCPTWTLEADSIAGSSIYNACSCSAGQKWCFEGSATITATSTEGMFIDSMIIWGHDMTDGSVITSLSEGRETSIGVVSDDACIDGYTQPVILSFGSGRTNEDDEDQREGVTSFTATITNNTGGPVCIQNIFIGEKLLLPEDALPEDFQNPHDGSDMQLDVEVGVCGPLSQTLKHVAVPLSLTFECVDLGWIKDVWRPYIRYAQRHGVMFQWSRNNCPQDIYWGWIEGPVQASTYTEDDGYSVTLEAEGFTTQPQPVLFDGA